MHRSRSDGCSWLWTEVGRNGGGSSSCTRLRSVGTHRSKWIGPRSKRCTEPFFRGSCDRGIGAVRHPETKIGRHGSTHVSCDVGHRQVWLVWVNKRELGRCTDQLCKGNESVLLRFVALTFMFRITKTCDRLRTKEELVQPIRWMVRFVWPLLQRTKSNYYAWIWFLVHSML